MKNLIITVLLAIAASLFGQTSYEAAMEEAMQSLELAESQDQFLSVSNKFQEIVELHPEQWEPRYYAIHSKTIYAFYLPIDSAMATVEKIESDYEKLIAIKDNDESKVLKAMYLTVKVAKDPMTYGQSLSPVIMSTYHKARKENPKNPRVLYQIAEYEIAGAPYMGKNPRDFCPLLDEAIELYKIEENTEDKGFEPRWGKERAIELYDTTCK